MATAPTGVASKKLSLTLKELAQEVMARCDTLAAFSEHEGELTRPFLSEPMKDAHKALRRWMNEAGMRTRLDAVGNLIGHYPGEGKGAPIFLLGSHIDTVRNAGKYDGMLGLLLAIAVVKALAGKRLPFGIDVIAFSEEEGVRFGTPYFGSCALTGQFDTAWLKLKDRQGISLAEAIRAYGLEPDAIPKAAYNPEHVLGFAEVHIEQGPVLEHHNAPLGVVEAIIGQSRLRLRLVGQAGHAGTSPMSLRRDALAGAAEVILAVEAQGNQMEGLVTTVGKLELSPNVSNVIPGEVQLSLDVRHKSDELRREAVDSLLARAQLIAAERKLNLYFETLLDSPTAWMSKAYTQLLAEMANAAIMVSGAGHDCAVMCSFTQSALIFVRSPGGISHHPDEQVFEEDVAAALELLSNFLERLALSHGV